MPDKKIIEKYRLYEAAVQDAHQQVGVTEKVYEENFDREPLLLKEDFCGTSWISAEWVQRGEGREALGLDIEQEVLDAGEVLHRSELKNGQQARMKMVNQNVLDPTDQKFDAIAACNFSYFIFHERPDLINYFKAAHQSLKEEGVFLLETAGGAGFIDAPFREHRTVKHESGKKKGKKWFKYTWHQRTYDPMFRRGLYSIHFELMNGAKMKDAFVYDWRIWTIPEIREILEEVGFSSSDAFSHGWDEDGENDGNYRRRTRIINEEGWLGYIGAYK